MVVLFTVLCDSNTCPATWGVYLRGAFNRRGAFIRKKRAFIQGGLLKGGRLIEALR